MAGLAILKHSYDLSDEALCDRWVENPYFQYFLRRGIFPACVGFDRSSLTRWRQRMGKRNFRRCCREPGSGDPDEAMKPSDLARVVIDTTVQPKAVMFSTERQAAEPGARALVRLV